MKSKNIIKKYINFEFFELPKNNFKTFFISKRMNLSYDTIVNAAPCIFLCNRTTRFDKELFSTFNKNSFVFLKDEYIFKINHGTLKKDEEKELFEQIEILKDFFVSIVVFPSNSYSVFGESDVVSKNMCDFVIKTNYNLRFLSLTESYFSHPIWSDNFLFAESKFSQKFTFPASHLKSLKDDEVFDFFNKKMPSSASTYAKHNEVLIRSNLRATGLSRIAYACPNCATLFSIYDEFNCLKCTNCGTAIEMQQNGLIGQSKKITNLDELKSFQFNLLKNHDFGKNEVRAYNNLELVVKTRKGKLKPYGIIDAKIYTDRIELSKNDFHQTLKLKEAIETNLLWNNNFQMIFPNLIVILHGKNNENLYIIKDLIEILKDKKK